MHKYLSIITFCSSCGAKYKVPEGLAGRNVPCQKCGEIFAVRNFGYSGRGSLPVIARLAIKYGYITEEQVLERILDHEHRIESGEMISFEDYLFTGDMFSPESISLLRAAENVVERRLKARQFGKIAVEKGIVDELMVSKALEQQVEDFKEEGAYRFIGKVLADWGVISADQCHEILEVQKSLGDMNLDFVEAAKTVIRDERPAAVVTEHAEPSPDKGFGSSRLCILSDDDISGASLSGEKGGLSYVITGDRMTAYVMPLKGEKKEDAVKLSAGGVLGVLHDIGVVFGLVETTAIDEFLAQAGTGDRWFAVAFGLDPRPGVGDQLKYHFKKDYMTAGQVSEEGGIDFRDRGTIPHVEEGDLLAEKIPGRDGVPGKDVFGFDLPVAGVEKLKLRCGSGAVVSDDGLSVFSSGSGQPKVSLGGLFSVLSELKIPGNVGYETGHVEFEGNIIIGGSIEEGFKVTGGNVEAGEILGGILEVTGNVVVSRGITGADIRAQGNVSAGFVHKSRISAHGDVVVNKEIMDSDVLTSGSCSMPRGKIISSEIRAKKGIVACDVGTELSAPSSLWVGVDVHAQEEISVLKESLEEAENKLAAKRDELDALGLENETIASNIGSLAHVQDRTQIEIRDFRNELERLRAEGDEKALAGAMDNLSELEKKAGDAEEEIGKLFDRQDEIEELKAGLLKELVSLEGAASGIKLELAGTRKWAEKDKRVPVLKASGLVFEGTRVSGVHSFIEVAERLRRVRFKEVKNTDPESSSAYRMSLL